VTGHGGSHKERVLTMRVTFDESSMHLLSTHDRGIDSLCGADSLIGASVGCDWDSGPMEPSSQDVNVGSSEEEGVDRLHRGQRRQSNPGPLPPPPQERAFWDGSTSRRLQGLGGGLGHLHAIPRGQGRYLMAGRGSVHTGQPQHGPVHSEPSHAPPTKRFKKQTFLKNGNWSDQQLQDLLTLSSHTSHALQPQDVSCFIPLKGAFCFQCDVWTLKNKSKGASKEILASWVSAALEKALTEKNVKSGFRTTGIFFFNPCAMDEKMGPSEFYRGGPSTVEEEVALGDPVDLGA
jgi:hypothetical protein